MKIVHESASSLNACCDKLKTTSEQSALAPCPPIIPLIFSRFQPSLQYMQRQFPDASVVAVVTLGLFRTQMMFILLLISSALVHQSSAAVIINNNTDVTEGKSNDDIISPFLERYYFSQEIDFLARQALILGDYHPTDAGKDSGANEDDDERAILKFIEKSLQLELDYIRRLRVMLDNPEEALANITATHNNTNASSTSTTKQKGEKNMTANVASSVSDSTKATKSTTKKEKEKKRSLIKDTAKSIIDAITEATWPKMASSPTASSTSAATDTTDEYDYTINTEYDYDWAAINGFGAMHQDWKCRSHAHSQTKPLYTPEMWDYIWMKFQQSTKFPFPKPTNCPVEPFYVNRTTDGKGRGNFASRNISKGSLVHSGHPNTVFFLDNASFYRFITSLPRQFACDVLEWAWQQDLTDSGNVVLCLNLDDSVFFNHGGYDDTNNIEMKGGRTSLDFYAMRDIQQHEELLYDYEHFIFTPEEMDL